MNSNQIFDSTEPSSCAKVQGTLDVIIPLAGASGGVLSWMVIVNASDAALSLSVGSYL